MTSRVPRAVNGVAGGEPVTLQQAHDVLRRQRPDVTASADRWRWFHERAAQVYRSVAALDGDHHFEALALASIATADAEKCGG
ncbi:MAG TPA: AMED_5909 family protein [Pseudonocardiaceae bacterium]|jgi:hypothetical protein|nr:AMED_5909 family protein [Pseudonocardiaceae bacterium]